MQFYFGDADGRRAFAPPAVIGGFRHLIAYGAEGDNDLAVALVVNERRDFLM
jgi:hypothetical protein